MERLHHNGVLVPPNYRGNHLTLGVKGKTIQPTPEQEEMAVAWVKKIGTPYVEDVVFAMNFHRDFSKKLNIEVKPGDVDYSAVLRFIEEARARKAKVSKEERKRLAAKRKAQREANREKYGYAWVDAVQMEVANYTAEPSSIFMGRGKHPLRGRWKEGPRENDIELNLSPDAPRPPGDWKAVLWIEDALWIARWSDKLTDKMKYIGLSDSSIIKQRKDIEKFERAKALKDRLSRVQRHIRKNLDANDLKRRKTATVCFLIDKLKIRVGDEKDEDEADTVGASTLRPEHLSFKADNTVTLNFLGKDSIPHVFNLRLPDKVVSNLKNFGSNAKATLFRGVDSKRVSDFLNEAMPGLTAKVFRTYYSSEAVDKRLRTTPINQEDSKHKKKFVATMANLEAARVCNHRRTIPKTWRTSLEKNKNRLREKKLRTKQAQEKLIQKSEERKQKYRERVKKSENQMQIMEKSLAAYRQQLAERKQKGKQVETLKKRISSKHQAIARQKKRLRELKSKHLEQMKKMRERLEKRRYRDKEAIEKLKLQIKTKEKTRDYNLGTSLKSYIDPRIYCQWGKKVNYDWKLYYPKTLQRKFSWVDHNTAPLEKKKGTP